MAADPFALMNRALNRGTPKGTSYPNTRPKKKLDPTNPKDIEYLRRMHPDFDEVMGSAVIDYRTQCQTDAGFASKFHIPPVLEPQSKFREHTNSVDAVCWGPEPDVFISASHDSTLKVWDARRGVCTGTLAGHSAGVYHCAVSPNGKLIVSCGSGELNNVLVWSWAEKKVRSALGGHKRAVMHATFSSDSTCAATVDQEGNLLVHDLERGACKAQASPHTGVVHASSFCPEDPNMICTVGGDGSMQLLDLREQVYPEAWRLPSVMSNAVALHPPRLGVPGAHDGHAVYAVEWVDRTTIFTGGADHKMKRWDLRKGTPKCAGVYLGHTGAVRSLAVSSDQRFVVSGCEDGSLRIWPKDPLGAVRANLKERRAEAKQVEAQLLEDGKEAAELKALQCKREELRQVVPSLKADEDRLKRDGYVSALRTLNGHVGLVSGCAWKEDATKTSASILSSSWDQSIQLFTVGLNDLV